MFQPKTAFSGFSVNDLAKAKAFYTQTLGLQVVEEGIGLRLHLPGGGTAVFTDHGKTQTAHHERLDGNGNWVPSMEVTLTKVK